jgi:hypothetical protein
MFPVAVHAADGEQFEQQIRLNAAPGLPAELRLTHPDLHIEKVRALLTIDNRFLVIPLRSLGGGEFSGQFPSPEKQVRYRFQFVRDNAKAELSPDFVAEQRCDPAGDERNPLIQKAIALDQDTEQIRFLSRLISGLEESRR